LLLAGQSHVLPIHVLSILTTGVNSEDVAMEEESGRREHIPPRRLSNLPEKLEERRHKLDSDIASQKADSSLVPPTAGPPRTQSFAMMGDSDDEQAEAAAERRSSLEGRFDALHTATFPEKRDSMKDASASSQPQQGLSVPTVGGRERVQSFNMMIDSDDEEAAASTGQPISPNRRSSLEGRFDALQNHTFPERRGSLEDQAADGEYPTFSGPPVVRVVPLDSGDVDADAGRQLLVDLMAKPPDQVAAWALKQSKQMQSGEDQLEIELVAQALQSAPVVEIQTFAKKVMSGVGALDAADRVEATRIALRVATVMKDPDALAANDQTVSVELLVAETLRNRSQDDLRELSSSVESEAAAVLAEPQAMLDVLKELGPQDRLLLRDVLLKTEAVPMEQRGLVEAVVAPGGVMDNVEEAFHWADIVFAYFWAIAALPALELALSFYIDELTCSIKLNSWMTVDSIAALCVSGATFFIVWQLRPIVQDVRADTSGAIQRWMKAEDDLEQQDLGSSSSRCGLPFETKLEAAVPGSVSSGRYRASVIGFTVGVLLFAFGLLWLVVGVARALETVVSGCSSLVFVWAVAVVSIRLVLLILLLSTALHVWKLLHKEPTVSAPYRGGAGYGTMIDAGA